MLVGFVIVDVSLNLDKLSSVDDSVEGSDVSSVSLVRCVTGHIVVSSSGFTAGCDSSGESWVVVDADDDDTLTGFAVVVAAVVDDDVDD